MVDAPLATPPIIPDARLLSPRSRYTGATMTQLATRLRAAIANGEPELRTISDSAAGAQPQRREAWSKKQELGHLIDSATNNRVRFITAALAGQFDGPTYDGRGWVELGGYADAPWTDLVELWARLNTALAGVVEQIPEPALLAPCRVADSFQGTLEALIDDYIRHLEHHLEHILSAR